MSREDRLIAAVAAIADSLRDEVDVVELLTTLAERCVDALGVDSAGIMLEGPDGQLAIVGSSSGTMRTLELLELQSNEGPCLDAFRTGQPVVGVPLERAGERWPTFAPSAVEAGVGAADAIPLRSRDVVIGALNLFRTESGPLPDQDLRAARTFASLATVAVLLQRTLDESTSLNAQLTGALESRVVIEQAKGIVAERDGIGVDEAFALLRRSARDANRRLGDVAADVVGDRTAR